MAQLPCCSQNFSPGDEVKRTSDDRLGWVVRIKPTGVSDAIVVKWQDTNELVAFFGQAKCNIFTKTGNNDPAQIS